MKVQNMDILARIKKMTDSVFNPQAIGNPNQASDDSGKIQGSLGNYAQPRNQFQGGGLPLYSNNINVRQPNFGQIQKPSNLTFDPMDIFNEGLEINTYGSAPTYPSDQYKEKQYLPYR